MSHKKLITYILIAAAVVAGISYFVGIEKIKKGGLAEVQTSTFDPKSLTWEEVPKGGERFGERDAGGAVVFKGKIFYYGGLDGNAVHEGRAVDYWDAPHYHDTWMSEDGLTWQKLTDANPWPPMRSISIAKFQNKLWLQGGWSPLGGYVDEIWSSEDGVNWQKAATIPWEEREGQVLEEYEGKLYMMGGVNFDKRKMYNDVWVTDDGINWSLVTESAPWKPRYDHDSVVYKDKLYVMGGVKLGGEGFADIWATSATDTGKTWEQITDSAPWGPLHGHTIVLYKGLMWIVGGWKTVPDLGSQEQWFSEDGVNWQKTTRDLPWIGREDHAAVTFKDHLWVWAGMDSDFRWHNDIWYSTTTSN